MYCLVRLISAHCERHLCVGLLVGLPSACGLRSVCVGPCLFAGGVRVWGRAARVRWWGLLGVTKVSYTGESRRPFAGGWFRCVRFACGQAGFARVSCGSRVFGWFGLMIFFAVYLNYRCVSFHIIVLNVRVARPLPYPTDLSHAPTRTLVCRCLRRVCPRARDCQSSLFCTPECCIPQIFFEHESFSKRPCSVLGCFAGCRLVFVACHPTDYEIHNHRSSPTLHFI